MKLFIIGLLVVNVIVRTQSYSIRIQNDKVMCDTIECPPNTSRCYAGFSNKENPTVLKHVSICYSASGEILAQRETTTPTDPNKRIHSVVNIGNSVGNNFNHKQFEANMKRNIQNQISEQQRNLQPNLEGMQRRRMYWGY